MKRREFLRSVVAAGSVAAGNLSKAVSLPSARLGGPATDAATASAIPSLDELAGSWTSGALIENRPSISNFHGSLLSTGNILAIECLTVPPLAQGSELGALSLDGEKLAAQEFRWYPYQVLRRARAKGVEVLTSVRMPFEAAGVLFSVEITNAGEDPRTVEVNVGLDSIVRQYIQKWEWDTPRPVPRDQTDFSSRVVAGPDGGVFLVHDHKSDIDVAFAFRRRPDDLSADARSATWTLHLENHATARLEFVLAAGKDAVLKQVLGWREAFAETWAAAKEQWGRRFEAAFTPDNGQFSGHLPTLVTDDLKVRKMFYASIVSLLCLERTNLSPQYPRVFVTASPRWATSLVYFWDAMMFATVWALLDPVEMRKQLILFLESDIHSCYAIDFCSMHSVGPWYSANDYAIFRLVRTYVSVNRDWAFLNQALRNGQTVFDALDGIALHWRTLTKPPNLLADYGGPEDNLETVPTYKGRTPAWNAANVWMMRSMAELKRKRGDGDQAAQLVAQANELAKAVLSLYVEGKGFWACQKDDGSKVEVRACIDFITTIDTMRSDLGQRRIDEMVAFVNNELWTGNWLRALSLSDQEAPTATRADHGSTGSYDAWPALTIEAFFRAGRESEALARLRSLEPATREGAFGQAHYVAAGQFPTRKAVSFGQDYFESCSGAFAEVIVRTIFGFAPEPDGDWRWSPPHLPGLSGQLKNVRFASKNT